MAPAVYAKTRSRSTMKGDWYEVKVAALLYLRSKNSAHFSRFQLATNVAGAGALDDIVHRWQSATGEGTPTWHTTLVQLKHKERATLRLGSFTGAKGDFSLRKYLTSFVAIKKAKLEGDCDNSFLLGGSICCFQLIIYTNAKAEKMIVKRKTESEKSQSTTVKTTMLEELLKSNLDDELIFKFTKESDEEVFSCLDDDKDVITEFFDKLTVFSGQPTESQLDDVIKKELSIACGGAASEVGAIYRIFEGLFKQWWRDSDNVLDEKSDIVQRAIDQLGAEVELTKQTGRCTLDLKFDERIWTTFNTGFNEGVALLHVVTTESSLKLSATKVRCLLHAEKLSFTFTSLEYLLKHQSALVPDWRDGYKDCLVVVSDSSEGSSQEPLTNLSRYVTDILVGDSNKKTILVSSQDCQLAMLLKDKIKYKILDDKFDLGDLDQSSQEKVFGTEVLFQGHTLPWKCLYDSDVSFWKSLSSDSFMETLLSQRPITIGAKLPRVVQHFIPRRLKRSSVLDKEFLKSVTTSGDVAVVSGGTAKEVLLHVGETLIPDDHTGGGLWVHTSAPVEQFEEMCRAHPNVHRLNLDGQVLRWIQSKGDMSTVKQFIDRSNYIVVESESVMVKDEKVVLVIAEPGMGKTTLVSTLANTLKKENSTDWVVQINLRDHTELFNQSPQLNAIDFLTLALGIDSPLEKSFLRASLEQTGNIVVVLDSFDEICPRYEVEGCGLLTSILETRVRKAVVTSRHCMQQVLENHLSTLAYNIVEFTEEDQKLFFHKFWSQSSTPMTSDQLEVFIAQLIDSVHAIDPDKQLMQVPLQTMMLAEVFNEHVMDPENNALPQKLDMLNLFEQFIDKKFTIFFRKGFINLSKSDSKCAFLENHKHAALMLLVPENDIQKLNSKQNIVANTEKFLTNIEGAKYNSGLVISVVNKKPVFLHQMFAEYFAGTWFSEHYQTNRDFLDEFLFHRNYNVVRVMFDRILAKGHRLHEALLDHDPALLDAVGCDVDARDAGGRSALHLAAALGYAAAHIDSSYRGNARFVGPRRRHAVEVLLERGASTNITDDVFHWTPLEYALKTRSWDAMEYLLVSQADATKLVLPTTTITDATLLEVVFSYGFVNLLTLLLDRGLPVNYSIHRKCLFHYAAQCGYLDIVELLLSRGGDIRAVDYNGNVPLHVASRFGHLLVVQALLQTKRRERFWPLLHPKNKKKWFDKKYVNILNSEGYSALHFAMTSDIVYLLVSYGADMWRRDNMKKMCLHTAAWYGRLSVVEALVTLLTERGEDVVKYVNAVRSPGISATSYAAFNGHADIVRLLLSHGADVWSRDNSGGTCLHYASNCNVALAIIESLGSDQDEVVKFINAVNNQGCTALAVACAAERVDLIRLLASHGANMWARDNSGRTSLHRAQNSDLVEALIESLGDDKETVLEYLNTVDSMGNTALIAAAREGHLDAVRSLLAHGANVWARDARGRTALHVAAENGCLLVAQTLIASLLGDKPAVVEYVISQDSSGLTARDVATWPCNMDRFAYHIDARDDLALWLDEILKAFSQDTDHELLGNTPKLPHF